MKINRKTKLTADANVFRGTRNLFCGFVFCFFFFVLCSQASQTLSHGKLKKGARKSAVNHQRKQECWLPSHLLGFIVFTPRLTLEIGRPESRSKGQQPDYVPLRQCLLLFVLLRCTFKNSLSDLSIAHFSHHMAALMKSDEYHSHLPRLFCSVDCWLRAHLFFFLFVKQWNFIQEGFIWLCETV